jgi:hypothetical protein
VCGCRRIDPRSGGAENGRPRVLKTVCLCLVIATLLATSLARGAAQSVLSYHGTQDLSGNFVVPRLTWDNAQNVHLDEGFRARISGHVYAQPLFWRVPGANSAMLLAATEDNVVYAIDAQSGREIWRRALGKSIPRLSLSCGNINPLGITGTPVIDDVAQTIFVDSAIENESGPHHLVFGLALKDGSVLEGWPVDVAQSLSRQRIDFVARDQNQRGALTILDGTVYVPFGGHFGDCGDYHGVVVGISISDARNVSSWATRARGGGIWAPGGLSTAASPYSRLQGIQSERQNGPTAKLSSAWPPIFIILQITEISSPLGIGTPSTPVTPIWVEPIRYCSTYLLPLHIRISSLPLARMVRPICWTATILEALGERS